MERKSHNVRRIFAILMFAGFTSYSDGYDCPRWLSVMPLDDRHSAELADDAADLGKTTFIDGIAWMCSVHPGGNPPADKGASYAEMYRKTSSLLRKKSSLKQGILLQSTMGHGGYPGTPVPWQLIVRHNGTSVYRMCPLDERFLAYIARTCKTLSSAKPDFFMVDDDTRLVWMDVPGCFCPLHLAEFSKRTGRKWTREEVVAMLKKGESADRSAWMALKKDTLSRLFSVIRGNFDSTVPGMLCSVICECHLLNAVDYAKILAAPGQKPIVRGSGAPYHDGMNFFHVVNDRSSYALQLDMAGKDVVYLQEADTCPHTLWATSATRAFDHLFILALEGCKGAKMWITRTSNYHEKKAALAYRRVFRANKGMMEWAVKTDFRQRGVVVPFSGPWTRNFADMYLSLIGVPYRFGKAGAGEVTAVTANNLKTLAPGEIRRILSGRVIADASAALWLAENGYSSYTGVSAKEWKKGTIQTHDFGNGRFVKGMRPVGLADLSDTAEGAQTVTRLLNQPSIDAGPVYVAPGSVLYRNSEGGTVLTLAQPVLRQRPAYHEATLFSEGYKTQMLEWLGMLSDGVPGEVCYLGAGPVMCMSGSTEKGESVFVLDALDIDGDEAPEIMFERPPVSVERLQGDGSWKPVRFRRTGEKNWTLDSPIAVQRSAVFRWSGNREK